MLIFLPRYQLFPYTVRVHLTTNQGGRYYAHFTDEETDSESLPQTHTLTKNIWGQNSNQSGLFHVQIIYVNYNPPLLLGSHLAQALGPDAVDQMSQGGANIFQTCLQGQESQGEQTLGNKIRLIYTKSCGPFDKY